MSIASIVTILVTFFICFKCHDYIFFLFLEMIWLSLFTNIGPFVDVSFASGYTRELFVGSVIIISALLKGNVKFSKKSVIISMCLIFTIILGEVNLMINRDRMPMVAPMYITYDDVFSGAASLERASFHAYNISSFVYFVLFIIVVLIVEPYLKNEEYISKIRFFLEESCIIFFVCILLEALLVNLFNFDNLRIIILNLFTKDPSKVYTFSTKRFFGIKSAFGFFSEPAYVSGPLLVFYLINYNGRAETRKIITFVISFLAAFCSGSTSCVLIMAFGVFSLFKMLLTNKGMSTVKRFGLIIIGILFIMIILQIIEFDKYIIHNTFDNIFEKINAYFLNLKTSNSSTISGYVRSYGNKVCYNILKSNPILGVGLGTTRGYGLIPSALACLGIFGAVILIYFYKVTFNINVSLNNMVPFIVFVIAMTGLFSLVHTYSTIMVSFLISFNFNFKQTLPSDQKVKLNNN